MKNNIKLYISNAINRAGDIVFDYINSIVLVGAASATSYLATYQTTEVMIAIIVGLFGGVIADRYDKKKILVIANLIATLVCIIAVISFGSKYLYMVLIFANMVIATLYALIGPSSKAIVPLAITDVEEYQTFNSINNTIVQTVKVVSPLIGVLIIFIFSPVLGIILNGATFLITALLIASLKTPQYVKVKSKNTIVKDLIEGSSYFYQNKQIFILTIMYSCLAFFISGYNFIIPFQSDIPFGELNYYSVLLTSEALGGVIAGLVFIRLSKKFKINLFVVALFMGFLLLIGIGFYMNGLKVMFIFMNMLVAVCFTIYNIELISLIQKNVDKQIIGRVFSIVFTSIYVLMPLGTIIFSLLLKEPNILDLTYVALGFITVAVGFTIFAKIYKII